MSTVRWHPRGESDLRRSKGSGYKLGVSGGWKSTQEMYERIRREMIEKAYASLAHSASCCKSEEHRGLQRQGRTTQWRDVYGEWVESVPGTGA
jgi:hypothetical protein